MNKAIADRFRKLLPVVVDVETAGFNPKTDALLEVAASVINMNEQGQLYPDTPISLHILPFAHANLDPEALAFNGIDPYHPFRFAVEEKEALTELFDHLQQVIKQHHCQRAVLIGHNAWFDLAFIKAAADRCQLKLPFHSFTSFDTATLAALAFGQTVLAKAVKAAGIEFDPKSAHSAVYDTEKTAELFCHIMNRWHHLNKHHTQT